MELNFLPNVSDKSDVILAQLMKAKSEMGSVVVKDGNNPHFKSSYASLGAHLEMSEATLHRHGLLMLHTPSIVNGCHVLVATLHHPESGQWIRSYLPLPNTKGDSQGIGSSITYMRRYSINSMLGLTAEDDDGEAASGRVKGQKEEKKPESKVTDKLSKTEIVDINLLLQQLDEKNKDHFHKWISTDFNATEVEDIPKSSFLRCMTVLSNKIKFLKSEQKAAV